MQVLLASPSPGREILSQASLPVRQCFYVPLFPLLSSTHPCFLLLQTTLSCCTPRCSRTWRPARGYTVAPCMPCRTHPTRSPWPTPLYSTLSPVSRSRCTTPPPPPPHRGSTMGQTCSGESPPLAPTQGTMPGMASLQTRGAKLWAPSISSICPGSTATVPAAPLATWGEGSRSQAPVRPGLGRRACLAAEWCRSCSCCGRLVCFEQPFAVPKLA